jgi:hypothetical protein
MLVTNPFSLFSQETHACRALAAEIRHDPVAFSSLLEEACNLRAGDILGVELELARNAKLDLVLGTSSGGSIGIEAKFDHEISMEQIQREKSAVDKLVLLVLSRQDVPARVHAMVDGVLTWKEAIAAFKDSRLTEADVEFVASRASKSKLRRSFHRVLETEDAGLTADLTTEGWRIVSESGNSGRPAILIESPEWESGRRLVAQIEGDRQAVAVLRRRVQATVGVTLFADEQEMPLGREPAWADPLRTLASLWDAVDANSLVFPLDNEAQRVTDETIRKAVESGKSEAYVEGRRRGQRKAELARQAGVPLMYVKGYSDSYIGMKSRKSPEAELPILYEELLSHMQEWWTAVDGR